MAQSQTKTTDRHQELMDQAYDRWQANKGMKKDEFWSTLSDEERFAVFTGNFNQQVCNGGFYQWHDNRYGVPEVVDYLIEHLSAQGPISKQVVGLLVQFKAIVRNNEEAEPDEDDCSTDPLYESLNEANLDSTYYQINDAFLVECEQALQDGSYKDTADAPAVQPASDGVRYPHIRVSLVGGDSNAFAILGACTRAARRAKLGPQEIEAFKNEATSGDYDHLLATCMKWFDVS